MCWRILLSILALAWGAPALAQEAHPALPLPVRTAWGFDRSDLIPHPAVRFGVLPNGMRYAIMRNAEPAGGLSVRLRIDVGATAEGEREQGFLHLVEHMIFIGSKTYPRGALLFTLPAAGLKRFSDFNAYTTFDETVFRLDLARADGQARETALRVMREIAAGLIFTRDGVGEAKQRVLEEIRDRDRANDILTSAQHAFLLPDTPLARGPVAGSETSVARAAPDALRRIYDLYYTPARATLVLVGDIDPAAAEAEVVGHFSGWAARADAERSAPPVLPEIAGARTHVFVHDDVPTTVTFALVKPLGGPDTSASRMTAYLEHLGSELLNRRLATDAGGSTGPIASATAAVYDYFSTARLASLDLIARNGDWRGALAAGEQALARALREGFSRAELNALLAGIQAGSYSAPRSSALADGIVDAVNRRLVFTAPADPSESGGYLAAIDVDAVNAAFRAAWSGAARQTFVSHDEAISGGEAAVVAALAQATAMGVGVGARDIVAGSAGSE